MWEGGVKEKEAYEHTTLNTAIEFLAVDGLSGDLRGGGDVADSLHRERDCRGLSWKGEVEATNILYTASMGNIAGG